MVTQRFLHLLWPFAFWLLALLGQPARAAVLVGTNLNVSKMAGNQTETTISINPLNPQNLFVAANNGTFPTPGIFRYTTNGGVAWRASDVSALPAACCDEASAWDAFGNLFACYLTVTGSTAVVAISTNGGASFSPVFQSATGIDQPSIAVGPGGPTAPGSVWVSFYSAAGVVVQGAAINGFGSVGPFSTEQVAPGPGGAYGDIAVGPTGEVMVTYQSDTSPSGPTTLYVNLDADGLGPAGFGPPVAASGSQVGSYVAIPAQPKRRIDAETGLAWDRSGGVHNGRVYLLYTDRPNISSSDTDIYLRYSDDAGANWSAGVRVNDDPVGRSQFLPRIAIDQTTANLVVSFYDCRNSPNNNTVQLWASLSLDGGASFGPNLRVSGGTSSALVVAVSSSGFDFGDYTGLAFHEGLAIPCWGDNSNSTGDNPDGTAHTLDVFISEILVPPALAITPAPGGTIILSWPSHPAGFQLESTPSLAPPQWRSVTNSVSDDGKTKSIVLPAGDALQCFRLGK